MQWLTAWAAWFAGIALCALALGDDGSVVFLPLILVSLLGLATLLVHEGGHYLAARSTGMTVLLVRIGRIELAPQRHGWRIRWGVRQKPGAAGYVIAAHDPARSLREQSLRMMAGGPGANLLVAAIAGPLGLLWLPHAWAWLMLAFAVLNAATGVANLIPSSRGLGSDGLKFLQWRHRHHERDPGFAHARLLALSISGVTADRLPEDQLAALDAQPPPMTIIALWYRLKAHQNRGQWSSAAGQQATFERLKQELPQKQRSSLGDLLACISTELAFSRAMRDHDGCHLSASPVSERTAWSSPALWPRCLALRALLDGDVTQGLRLLDETHRLADQSMDRSLVQSEALIRNGMLALVATRQRSGFDSSE